MLTSVLSVLLAVAGSVLPTELGACASKKADEGPDAAAKCYLRLVAKTSDAQRRELVAHMATQASDEPADAPLWYQLGRITWAQDAAKGEAAFKTAARLYEASQNWEDAASVHVTHLTVLQRRQAGEELRAELRDINAFATRSPSPVATALARSAVARFQLASGERLDPEARAIQKLDEHSLRTFPAKVAIKVLATRVKMAQEELNHERAFEDLELMTAIAQASGDAGQINRAAGIRAYYFYDRAFNSPSLQNTKDAMREAKALCTANQVGGQQSQASMCRVVIELSSRIPQDAALTRKLLDQCRLRAQALRNRQADAECLRLRSEALAQSDPKASLQAALEGLSLVQKLDAGSNERLSLWERLMHLYWEQRSPQEARIISRAALFEIESLRDVRSEARLKLGSFAMWTSNYKALANRLLSTQGGVDEAFAIQERSRARALWDTLGSEEQNKIDQAKVKALRVSLQDAIIQWSQRIAQDQDPSSPGTEPSLASIDKLNQEIQQEAYANWRFSSLKQIQRRLGPDQAMISYQVAVDRAHNNALIGGTWAILITRDKAIPVKLDADRLRLERATQTFTRAIRSQSASAQKILDKIGSWVIKPLLTKLDPKIQELIIVPDGPLYSVPFFALDSRYRYTLTPSATIWAALKDKAHAPAKPSSIVLVDPTRTSLPEDPASRWAKSPSARKIAKSVSVPLPNSRNEIESIHQGLGGKVQALTGEAAHEDALLKLLKGPHNLLHISAHSIVGLNADDPSAIALASAGRKDFGLFEAPEIRALSLPDSVVVLGGCETGWGTAVAGEGMLSIARSFQEAGARAVLASLWPLRDDHTALFFDRFYQQLGQGLPMDQALALTQRALKEEGYPLESYAPFVILGDGSAAYLPDASAQSLGLGRALTGLGCAGLLVSGVLWWRRKRQRSAPAPRP